MSLSTEQVSSWTCCEMTSPVDSGYLEDSLIYIVQCGGVVSTV